MTVYTIELTDEATGERSFLPGYFTLKSDAQDALWELGREFRAYHKRIVCEWLDRADDEDA